MREERISRNEIDSYKRDILEHSVLIRVEEVAVMLAVKPCTVKRIIEEGKITAYDRTGRMTSGVRVLASELKEYVRSIRLELKIS